MGVSNNWKSPDKLRKHKRLVQKRKVVLIQNEQRTLAGAVTVVLKIVSVYNGLHWRYSLSRNVNDF